MPLNGLSPSSAGSPLLRARTSRFFGGSRRDALHREALEILMAMPGVERLTTDLLVEAVAEAKALGIPAIAIFPGVGNS